jgi:hypothetical protein
VVVLLLAGLIVFWSVAPDDTGAPAAQSDPPTTSASSEQTTTEQQTTAGESTAESTSAEQTSESPPAGDPLTAANIEAFLLDYHQQVLSDPRAAYARTGPTLRAAISEDNYVDYWSQFSDVRISDIQATDGNTVATATMELVFTDGSNETAGHTFTFIVDGDQLILDSDVQN